MNVLVMQNLYIYDFVKEVNPKRSMSQSDDFIHLFHF